MGSERARAHHHAYTLLARLYRDGPTAALLPYVREIAPLAAALPARVDADEVAAAHQHLWGFTVYPFESYFLDPSGLLGGARAEAARGTYARAGYAPPATHEPDYLAVELEFMAHLSLQGSAGLAAQRVFLHEHLARWMPPLLVAVSLQGDRFYGELAALTGELIGDHLASFGDAAGPAPLGPTDDPLEDERSGLRRIARHLATPYHAGLHLSRDGISDAGRRLRIPSGFGSREQTLETLLREAARFERLPALLDELARLTTAWRRGYEGLASAQPALGPYVMLWSSRLEGTERLLSRMRSEAQRVAG